VGRTVSRCLFNYRIGGDIVGLLYELATKKKKYCNMCGCILEASHDGDICECCLDELYEGDMDKTDKDLIYIN
jgi:hypothetical protein